MTASRPSLLIAATAPDDTAATKAWQQWRSSMDLQTAPWQQIQLLPLIPHDRFAALLAGDEHADVLHGIVRRAWTEAQLRLATLRLAATCIADAGCTVALFGTAAMHLRAAALDSIRPIDQLRLLVPRTDFLTAVGALQASGWQPHCPMPVATIMDWQTDITLVREGVYLHLHWRAIDVPAHLAAECERLFLSRPEVAPIANSPLYILSADHDLIIALSADRSQHTKQSLLSHFDAAILAPQIPNWRRWAALAAKYHPPALESLAKLRSCGLAVPVLRTPRSRFVLLHRLVNAIRWRSRRLHRRLFDAAPLPRSSR